MDGIFEQVVHRTRSAKSILLSVFIILATAAVPLCFGALAVLINEYFYMLAFFDFLLLIYASWYVITSQNVDFEYSASGDDVTISKIIAQRKRKLLVKFSAKNIEEMQLVSQSDAPIQAYDKTVFAGNDGDPNLCWVSVYSEKSGRSLIVFSPDDDFLAAIKPYLKRSIVNNFFKN